MNYLTFFEQKNQLIQTFSPSHKMYPQTQTEFSSFCFTGICELILISPKYHFNNILAAKVGDLVVAIVDLNIFFC